MDLKEILNEYNECTLEAIKYMKLDKDIEPLVEKREILINLIKEGKMDAIEGNDIAKKLNIFENEKMLNNLIADKKIEIKNEIELIKKRKMARQNYSNYASKPVYFNKQI